MIPPLASLEIPTDRGKPELFHCIVLKDDESRLIVSFQGVLANFRHHGYSYPFIERLKVLLPQHSFASIVVDITQLELIDDPCMYSVMDIVDMVFEIVSAPAFLCLRKGEEWQEAFARILIGENENGSMRATIIEVAM